MVSASRSHAETLASPLELPTGHVLPSRIVKAAMEEAMASFGGGPPNAKHLALYDEWAKGGYGMILTGA